MKKFLFTLACTALLLGTASCNNDKEPSRDLVLYAQNMVTHVADKTNDTFVCAEASNYIVRLNPDNLEASIQGAFMLGDEEVSMSLSGLKVTIDRDFNGYVITLPTTSAAVGKHTITEFKLWVDARVQGMSRHIFHFVVDDKYCVNALQPIIPFEVTTSQVTLASGETSTSTQSIYSIQLDDLKTHKATVGMFRVGFSVLDKTDGIYYKGLQFEPTAAGYHVYYTDETPLQNTMEMGYTLEAFDANINLNAMSITANYSITNTAQVNATGKVF